MAEAAKQEVLKMIEGMPDNASIEDIMYELYIRSNIQAGLADVYAGRTIPHEEVMREFTKWLQSTGP
jgi:predicted transcriptional regulator